MKRLGLFCALMPILAGCAMRAGETGGHDAVVRSVYSSVQLFTERADLGRRAGSAVVLATDASSGRALILTTAHLLEPPVEQSVFAKAPSSAGRSPAKILAVDADLDLAILEANGLPVSPAAIQTETRLGDDIWVISYPWGRRMTLVDGAVSQIRQDGDGRATFPITGPVGLIDAPVSYGASGGGVYDDETGRLIGIVRGYRTAKLSVPGSDTVPLEVPIGGETTVISTPQILCFLKAAAVTQPVSAELSRQIAESDC
ncbi:S1 family peptidase [Rhodospirillaceae bacterium SYSU D60014]|uniref:S1 family peptidase n=1 Tax=Virgifigura deserti TaxID=2268457 RepID=UPI000E660CC3